MSLVEISPMAIPFVVDYGGGAWQRLDASGEKLAMIFQIPKTGTLKKICFFTGSVTTADDLTVRLETVDTSTGFPTGNLYVANATGSVSLVDTDDYKGFWVGLNGSSGVSVTAGDMVALVIGITYVNGSLQIQIITYDKDTTGFPYVATYTGSWVKSSAGLVSVSLQYSTGIVPIIGSVGAAYSDNASFSSSSNPNRRGNTFVLPFGCRAVGVWVALTGDNAFELLLYDTDAVTVLRTISPAAGIKSSAAGYPRTYMFPSSVELSGGVKYRIVIRPTTTYNVTYYHLNVVDDGSIRGLDARPLGYNCRQTTCNGAPANEASWTQTDTRRIHMGIIIDAIEVGSAGGVIGAGGLHGGFQG